MLQSRTFIAVLLAALMLASAYADNPVLCKIHQITGKWKFTFDTATVKKGTKDYERMSCGRHQPMQIVNFDDDPNAQNKFLAEIQGLSEGEEPKTREAYFELTHNQDHMYQLDQDGNQISDGRWTMVIHEGFMGFIEDVTIGEMITFSSFYRYNLIDEGSKSYESICYETMVGWYHTINPDNEDDEDWGCFYAKKVEPTEEDLNEEFHAVFKNGGLQMNISPETKQCDKRTIKEVRDHKLTWSADSSVGAATADDYVSFSPTRAAGIEDEDLESDGGSNKGKLKKLGNSYRLLGLDPDTIDTADLPPAVNWNDVGGYSFFPDIKNQACGDCYLVATESVIESRISIMTNGRINTKLSLQQQKDCNFYIERCDGGLPINVAKYGWEFQIGKLNVYIIYE